MNNTIEKKELFFHKKILLFFMLCLLRIQAQEHDTYSVSYSTFYGEGIGNIKGIESNHAETYKLSFSKKLYPKNADWIKFLNADNFIISAVYSDMNGMVREFPFGNSFGIISEIDFRILGKGNSKIYFTPGLGLSYIDQTVFTNPNTFIFGSHINGAFSATLKYDYHFLSSWSFFSSINFMHYSNGSFRIPNAGVNFVNIGLGIKKDFDAKKDFVISKTEKPMQKNGIEIVAGVGERGKYKTKDGFFRMGFYAGYSRFLNNVVALRAGLDGVYYAQTYNPLVYDDTVPYWGKSYDHFRLGTSIGAELKLNKFAINGNFGRYIYMKSPYHQKMYWNAALKYYVTPKFGLQATLNAHKFQADFINWGLFCRL